MCLPAPAAILVPHARWPRARACFPQDPLCARFGARRVLTLHGLSCRIQWVRTSSVCSRSSDGMGRGGMQPASAGPASAARPLEGLLDSRLGLLAAVRNQGDRCLRH